MTLDELIQEDQRYGAQKGRKGKGKGKGPKGHGGKNKGKGQKGGHKGKRWQVVTAAGMAANLQGCDQKEMVRGENMDQNQGFEVLEAIALMAVIAAAIMVVAWIALKLWRAYSAQNRELVLMRPLKGVGKGKRQMGIELTVNDMERIENHAYERGLREGMERVQSLYDEDNWRLSEMARFHSNYGHGPLGLSLEREIRARQEIRRAQLTEMDRWRENGVLGTTRVVSGADSSVRHKGKGPINVGKGSNPRRGSNPAKGQGKQRQQGPRGKGKSQPTVLDESEASTEHGSEFETGALSEEHESHESERGSNQSSASVGSAAMTGVITAAIAESVVAGAVSEQDSTALVATGARDVGLIESHTGYTGWIWLLLIYVVISLFRDLKGLTGVVFTFVKRHVKCLKREKTRGPLQKDDKVVVWTTKFGNKLHFSRECSFLEKSKATYGHEACAGCLRELEKFWCTQCSSTHETSCEIRKRYL